MLIVNLRLRMQQLTFQHTFILGGGFFGVIASCENSLQWY